MVTSEARMSERIKTNQHGFKTSQCKGISCFCCNTDPPTLSTKITRNLGKDMCKILAKDLVDEELKKKPQAKKPARPKVKQNNKGKQQIDVANEES
jgi:hypothetical protein